jgi:hypothetical protein
VTIAGLSTTIWCIAPGLRFFFWRVKYDRRNCAGCMIGFGFVVSICVWVGSCFVQYDIMHGSRSGDEWLCWLLFGYYYWLFTNYSYLLLFTTIYYLLLFPLSGAYFYLFTTIYYLLLLTVYYHLLFTTIDRLLLLTVYYYVRCPVCGLLF